MTSPLQHLPMSEQPAVRSQIKEASKLPRYPHGHVMETMSSRPTVRRLDAASVSPLNYSQVRILLSLHPSIKGLLRPSTPPPSILRGSKKIPSSTLAEQSLH